MSLALPAFKVGDPVRHEKLAVFPLFSESGVAVEYRLSDSALGDQSLLIEEINESGSVPELLVENKGDLRVLFLEGEELVGAKQNRILNTSVLVGAHTRIKIPVSCVEQGRWGRTSRYFSSSGSHSPSRLRRALKVSVSKSIRENRAYCSDQGAVWKEVNCLHDAHDVPTRTGAMSDAFRACKERIEGYQKNLPYVRGACGMAVAIGAQVITIDVFDKPSTCEKVWHRLLTGVVFDALDSTDSGHQPGMADVEKFMATLETLSWQQSAAIGEGDDYRAESGDGDHASALALQSTVVHGSMLSAV